MNRRLRISFSGGETSAYMTKMILDDFRHNYDDVAILFANTGQEHEETLRFVDMCDKKWGLGVVWLEGYARHGERRTAEPRVVTYETADRTGKPFEEFIKKHGIPNRNRPGKCTDELKLYPMQNYTREVLGWGPGTYDTAVGIRVDEIDRMSSMASMNRVVYPLIQWRPTTKKDIKLWWSRQDFSLGISGYQGNCVWCWKKSFRKHYTLIHESPEIYDFPRRMESMYGHIISSSREASNHSEHKRFFRGNRSVEDLFREYRERLDSGWCDWAKDEYLFDVELDGSDGCEESCEVFSEGSEAWQMTLWGEAIKV